MVISYEHTCPNCGSDYCEDFDIDNEIDEKDFTCEDCGEQYHVYAEINIDVTVS